MRMVVTVDTNNYEFSKCKKILVQYRDYGDTTTYGGPDISVSFFSDNQIPRCGELQMNKDDAIKLAYSILSAAAPRKEITEFSIS